MNSLDAVSAKKAAKAVKKRLADLGCDMPLGHAYEAVAAVAGFPTWAVASARIETEPGKTSDPRGTKQGTLGHSIDVLNQIGICVSGDYSNPKAARLRILTETVFSASAARNGGKLDAGLREAFSFKAVMSLLGGIGLDSASQDRLRTYLDSLPSFCMDKGLKQSQTTLDAHNELTVLILEAIRELRRGNGMRWKS